MATNVILPALGMAQDTGKIVEWLRAEGQHVTAGEPLVVIETDKAAVDLEAPATGILARVSARAGDEVPVAQVIAVILSAEEAEAGVDQADGAPAHASSPAAAEIAPNQSGRPAPEAVPAAAALSASAPSQTRSANGRRLASPKARRMAAARGVDLTTLHGTGPGGVVVAADVLAAESLMAGTPVAPPAVTL